MSREIERLLNELEAATSQNAMLSKEAERARALAAEAKKVERLVPRPECLVKLLCPQAACEVNRSSCRMQKFPSG